MAKPNNQADTLDNTHFIPAMVSLARQADSNAENAWLSNYRKAHIAALETAAFPHPQVEHFKYNRLDAFDTGDFAHLAQVSDEPLDIGTRLIDNLGDSERIVFVDGQFSAKLSQFEQHNITSFADANATQQAKILAALQAESIAHNPFTQINASLANQGILIEIDEQSPQTLIEVLQIVNDTAEHSTLATQVIIDVADNSKAAVINRSLNWDLTGKKTNLSTQRTVVNVGCNAHFTHYTMQLDNANSLCFSSSEYHLQSHATLKAFYGATGSILKKMDVTVNHKGQHAQAFLNGLYAATEHQQIDYHTTINHPFPNGQTDEIFRGIVNDSAEATFNGRIHIYEDAQKTRAELSNKNLILSDNAVIHTKPELEIYADDVVCAHGATISRLDDASLNYLRARAIPKAEAELMLSYGFFNEVLAEIEHEAIADYLRPILFKRFESL